MYSDSSALKPIEPIEDIGRNYLELFFNAEFSHIHERLLKLVGFHRKFAEQNVNNNIQPPSPPPPNYRFSYAVGKNS